ncbi:MAG: acyl-CoA/acyl-ACP dehydrogenase [Pseudonocardiales bacterium]|nr:acyl-CoA/acyl-ACP dehydrogenase [Pseudonocardiales bacterium]
MNFLHRERDCLERYLPGLDKQLAEVPLLDLERPNNPGLSMFRQAGGPALLIPETYGGLGASLADAVGIQRAIGSRSPSLAVATTMHHFSVASLVELTTLSNGFEWAMLQAIAENRWLLSSGFAEGRSGQHILAPTMNAIVVDGGLRVSGAKKPCSLTWSMDLMSASVTVTDQGNGSDRMAIILIPATSEGIERKRFWNSWVLAGAESDEVILRDVLVPDALVFYPTDEPGMDPIQARGFIWFELLISAAYVGAASNLTERVITSGRGSAEDQALLAIELESATATLESAATTTATADDTDSALARALYVRYSAERAIERAAMAASAIGGGMTFIGSSEIAYLLAASRALAFHPPSRTGASEPLARHLAGAQLAL